MKHFCLLWICLFFCSKIYCSYSHLIKCENGRSFFVWNKTEISPLEYQLSYCKVRCDSRLGKMDQFLEECLEVRCGFCSCSRPSCEIYNNCCPDMSVPAYKLNLATGDSFPQVTALTSIKNSSANTARWLESIQARHNPVLSCSEDIQGYYLFIKSCLPDHKDNKTVVDLCEKELAADVQTLDTYIKAVDMTTNVVYRNIYCAICNGVEKPVQLKTALKTENFVFSFNATSELEIFRNQLDHNYNEKIEFYPRQRFECLKQGSKGLGKTKVHVIDSCDVSDEQKDIDKDVETACLTLRYNSLIILTNKYYQNIFCAICNLKSYPTIPAVLASLNPSDNIDLPLTMLLNFNTRSDVADVETEKEIQDKSKQTSCTDNEWLAPDGSCLRMFCFPGKDMKNGSCVERYQYINGLGYSLQLWLIPSSGKFIQALNSENKIIPSQKKIKTLLQMMISKIQNICRAYVITAGVIYKSSNDNDEISTIKHGSEIFWLDGKLLASANFTRSQFESEIIQRIFYNQIVSSFNTTWLHHFQQFNALRKCCGQTFFSNISDVSVKSFQKSAIANIENEQAFLDISATLLCKYISFNTSMFSITTTPDSLPSDITIIVDLNVTKISISEYQDFLKVNMDREGNLNICHELLEEKIEATKKLKSKNKRKCNKIMCTIQQYLTISCLGISMFCLLFTLLTYSLCKMLRTEAGIYNMFLAGSLLLAQFCLLVTSQVYLPGILCIILGMVTHFMWLWMFSWSLLCSYFMYKLFTSKTRVQAARGRLWKTVIVTLTLPTFLVVTVAVYSYLRSQGLDFGYGQIRCYIDSNFIVGLSLVVPLVFITICNILLYMATVHKIYTVTQMRHEEMVVSSVMFKKSIYLKLSSLTGAFWTVAILAEFVDNDIVRCIAIVTNGLQGVMIFVSFICNTRVVDLYRTLWCRQM